jgi:hypothetical protein
MEIVMAHITCGEGTSTSVISSWHGFRLPSLWVPCFNIDP